MAKDPLQDRPTKITSQVPVTRTARFWADDMAALEKLAAVQGKSEWDEVRYLIRERVSGRVVVLSGLKPEFLGELQKYANENAVNLEEAVKLILTNFVADRRRTRK